MVVDIELVKMSIVYPIFKTNNLFSMPISLDENMVTKGFVLCEDLRTVDLTKRNAYFVEKMPIEIFNEVKDIMLSCIEKHLSRVLFSLTGNTLQLNPCKLRKWSYIHLFL